TRLQEGEQFSETVDRDAVDIQGFASQFAERVEQDGRDETRLPKLAGDQLEQLVHSLLNELVGLLFMNRVLACETGLGDVRPFGKMLANAIETFPRHSDWRHVGLRIHPRLPRKGPAVHRRAIGSRFPRLRGNAFDRCRGPWDHLINRPSGLFLFFRDENERVLLPGSKSGAGRSHLGWGNSVGWQFVGMKDSGHPRDPRMGGEFGPQLVLQETGKSRQGPSEDYSAFLQSGGN